MSQATPTLHHSRPASGPPALARLRRGLRRPLVPLTVLTVLLLALVAQAGKRNRILGVDVEGQDGVARTVRIRTAQEPTFTVFRLSSPMRVVVDVSGGDVSSLEGPMAIEDGVVEQVAFRQFSADGFLIGRLIVGFENELTYDVQAEGNAVVIRTGKLPGSSVDRAPPPPVAPVDRVAAERFEVARRDADRAAARATRERQRAEEAAAAASQQQQEATRIARDAERARADAERAKAEAESLHKEAQASSARDREAARKAAQQAEQRLRELEDTARAVARSRAEAERLAAQAESAQRDAEETAARAEAQHKTRVADLQQRRAEAEKEKRAAKEAWGRAEAAKREAALAQQAADQAREAARRARDETARKLERIALRERKAEEALARVAGERRAVEEERQRLAAREQQVAARQQKIAADRRALESKRHGLAAEQERVESRLQEIDSKDKATTRESKRLKTLQTQLERAQKQLDDDRRQLEKAKQKLAVEQKTEAERKSKKQGKQRQAAVAERQQMEKARLEIADLRKRVSRSQARLDGERQELTTAREKLAAVAKERDALMRDRERLDTERQQVAAELERQRRALAKAREETKAAQAASRRAKVEVEKLVGKPKKAVAVASLGNVATDATPAHAAARAPRKSYLRGVKRHHSGSERGILLLLDRKPDYEVQRIEDPPRLVIDLEGTKRTAARTTYGVDVPFVRRVRLGDHGSLARVVVDLSADDVEHRIKPTSRGLLVSIDKTAVATAQAEPAPPAKKVALVQGQTLRDVKFSGGRQNARITLDVSEAVKAKVDDRSKRAWVLELSGATVPESLQRSLDTSAYGSVVRLVSTYQASKTPAVVNVVANLEGPATHTLKREGDKLVWDIRGRQRQAAVVKAAAPQTAAFTTEAAVVARSTPKQTRKRNKKRISIDLKDADIVNVIRLIAEVSGENIITGDDISGKVTLRLRNVPWDKALDTILKSQGYDRVRHHNIIRVAPEEKLKKEQEVALAKRQAREQVEDTVIKMITVNYASASEIAEQLKNLLTPRGVAQTNERTNTIILEEVKSNVSRIVELAMRLDKQTPQVLIEARIVEASNNNLKEIGIQWGGTGQAAARNGNPTGLIFPGDVMASGAADDLTENFTGGVSSPGRYAVNLPAPIGSGSGGGIGFIFGSAGGGQLLNLRLTALEETGKGRIISSPRITTLDNRTAKISQGVDIPITVVSAAGANTRFVPASLELEVTPHVTNDGSVLMHIKTSKNEPNFARTGANGDPTIEKKEAETEVLVRDGDTAVIGGIYTRSESTNYAKVPFFGDIPILGWLFKRRRTEVERKELLVFITPQIVNRAESIVGTGPAIPGGAQSGN